MIRSCLKWTSIRQTNNANAGDQNFGYRHLIYSIDFRYVIVLVGSGSAIQFTKTVELSAILSCKNIVRQIHIPPGTVKIDSIPGVRLLRTIIRRTVNSIARNILTAAKCGEQMGKVKANTLLGLQRLSNIKVLEEWITVVVILEVGYDPIIKSQHLFFVGLTTGANFVSKFFRLRIPQGISAVGKMRCFRFEDEII